MGGASLAAPAAAIDFELYGQARLHLNYIDDGDDYSAVSVSNNASVLGARGTHELDPAITAIVQLETQVNLTNSDDDILTFRDCFAGFEGSLGLFRIGRYDTPVKLIRTRTDLFGNQVGDPRNLVRSNYELDGESLQGFDERMRNALGYRTPQVNGWLLDFAYSPDGQSDDNAADDNDDDAVSASLVYRAGPAFAALGYERWNRDSEPDIEDRDVVRAGAYYDWAGFRFTAFAQSASDPDDNVYGGGVRYAVMEDVFLKSQYYSLDANDSDFDANMLAVGSEYHHSPELTLYLNYARTDNDGDEAQFDGWSQGSSLDGTNAAGKTNWVAAAGFRYRF